MPLRGIYEDAMSGKGSEYRDLLVTTVFDVENSCRAAGASIDLW